MSESSSVCGSSCGDCSDVRKIKREIRTKHFDLSKFKLMPKKMLETTLVQWRSEQLQKVEEELHLLRIIEDMMKNSDAERFEGYTDKMKLAELMKNVRSSSEI
ncbi:uncharacterized protein LOC123014886 [Tribolium madens]|uniref:uncharacterized protein LOC123014886 n=1 Tax=Tribolium madens TaxID=41895 RepID=UPI001CF76230|nr:uncharacterized protein LOC123014886 [Tribolium madens]